MDTPYKYRTSTPQVPLKYPSSLDAVTENTSRLVKAIGNEQLSVNAMLTAIGLKDRKNFVELFLTPAIAEGFIRMLYPNTPRHPRQKYLLTAKGIRLYNAIKDEHSQ